MSFLLERNSSLFLYFGIFILFPVCNGFKTSGTGNLGHNIARKKVLKNEKNYGDGLAFKITKFCYVCILGRPKGNNYYLELQACKSQEEPNNELKSIENPIVNVCSF